MTFSPTPLKGSYTIQLQPFTDSRGWFSRTYSKDEFLAIHHTAEWVQTNHSYTTLKGTIRGLHYQEAPYKEIKLVRCIRGTAYDVIVDIRKSSPTFLQWFAVELSDQKMNMMYIPEGFAHGFQTLTNDCELLYNHSQIYVPGVEKGLAYNDPKLNITWPVALSCISQRDDNHGFIPDNFKGV